MGETEGRVGVRGAGATREGLMVDCYFLKKFFEIFDI